MEMEVTVGRRRKGNITRVTSRINGVQQYLLQHWAYSRHSPQITDDKIHTYQLHQNNHDEKIKSTPRKT